MSGWRRRCRLGSGGLASVQHSMFAIQPILLLSFDFENYSRN